MTKKTLVVQHNDIINARYNMSTWEQRIVKLLISMIGQDDDNFKFYRLSSKDIAEVFGLYHKDVYKDLKAAVKRLKRCPIYIQISEHRELELSWVASAEYIHDEGVVELEISAKLRPYLLQLKDRFTQYEFWNILKLNRQYSFRLFDLIRQHQYQGKCRFTVKNLRHLLDIGEEKYKLYKDFKKYAIQPAVDEILENTEITFEMVEIRKWKTVVEIEFLNIKNKKWVMDQEEILVITSADKSNVPESPAIDKEPPRPAQDEDVLHLVALGVHEKTVWELIEQYGKERVQDAIAYTQAQQKKNKLTSPAGFVIEAVKKGYQDPETVKRRQVEEEARRKQEQEQAAREQAERWNIVKREYTVYRGSMALQHVQSLEQEKASQLWNAFLDKQPDIIRNKINQKLASDNKKDRQWVDKAFLYDLANTLALPSLPEWAARNGKEVLDLMEEIRRDGLA